jgi:tetratricopeptide (TPR) repeat protein
MLSALSLTAATARADDRVEAREHYQKGTKAFDLGLYDVAIKEYMAAYEFKDDPALLYNIAQAHRLAGHATEALRFYRRFLIKAPNNPHRDEVEQKIAELQKLVDQQNRTQSLPPESTIKPTNPAEAATPAGEAAPPVATPSAAPAEAPPVAEAPTAPAAGRTKKLAGLITAVAGVGLLGAGIACGVLAKNASDDLTNLDRSRGTYDPGKYDAGKLDQTLEGVFLGVGAAAVAAGAVIYVLGYRETHSAGFRASIAPVLSPQAAGLTARFSF